MNNASILPQLILIVILTLINAFFAASEIAIVSMDQKKLKQKSTDGDEKSKLLVALVDRPSRFLSTIQVGITFAGFFSSASAAVGISDELSGVLESLGIPFAYNISFITVTVLLSYFVLIFGELVPKRIALQDAEKFARLAVTPLTWISKIMYPFVSFLTISTNFIIRLLGFKTDLVEERITLEEIKSLIEVGEEQGVIEAIEKDMITSIMTFDNKLAKEIMTARPDVFMIEVNTPFSGFIGDMIENQYSRIPVYEDTSDKIVGVLYQKDLFKILAQDQHEPIHLKALLRPGFFVPERKNINDLFIEMQNTNQHLALLIDQYGGFSGIVTMEDLLEEIVGNIEDEYDSDTPDIFQLDSGDFKARGKVSIKELNRMLHSNFDESSTSFDTLGGMLIHELGYIPSKNGTSVSVGAYTFTIEKISDNKIEYVSIS